MVAHKISSELGVRGGALLHVGSAADELVQMNEAKQKDVRLLERTAVQLLMPCGRVETSLGVAANIDCKCVQRCVAR